MNAAAFTPQSHHQYILSLGCPDSVGLISRVSTFIAEHGGNIVEASQFSDLPSGWFFTRQAIGADTVTCSLEQLRADFAELAETLGPEATWSITDTSVPQRIVVLASKEGHCLHDLLGRIEQGDYPGEIVAVIANHRDLEKMALDHGVPFHYVPFPPDAVGKRAAFEQVRDLVEPLRPDAVVLARFMQILPPDLCQLWEGKAINIHHSFLPSFMGARPYHQAYRRGVKLIGATCHYATSDLDDGPIIEQDVIRVRHSDIVPDLKRQGRDAEKLVLARGLRWHLERRVQVYGNRTVIFS